jgi:hypothetical protein
MPIATWTSVERIVVAFMCLAVVMLLTWLLWR